MQKIPLIIKREYLTRVQKKAFIVMTFLGPILIAGMITLAVWLGLSESGIQRVLVIDKQELVTEDLENSEEVRFFYQQEDISDKAFMESRYDLLLYINEEPMKTSSFELYYKNAPSFFTQKYISSELERVLEDLKLRVNDIDPRDYREIRTSVNLKSIDIDTGKADKYKRELAFVGFFFALLIYIFIFMYGVQVMRGVIEEKTNRIVEVIVSSVRPFQLMMGKIVGVALVGLTQFVLWIVFTLLLSSALYSTFIFDRYDPANIMEQTQVSSELEKKAEASQVDKSENPVLNVIDRIDFPFMLGMFLFYFLGGYLLYSALFAAVGAAVDSESDTQQFMMPLTIPLIFGFIVAEMALQNPEGPAAVWFSIIPLTSPVVMMVKVAIGFDAGNVWQLILSMLLLVLGFLFTTWLAARIYRTGILMYGKKATYKELWKWLVRNEG